MHNLPVDFRRQCPNMQCTWFARVESITVKLMLNAEIRVMTRMHGPMKSEFPGISNLRKLPFPTFPQIFLPLQLLEDAIDEVVARNSFTNEPAGNILLPD